MADDIIIYKTFGIMFFLVGLIILINKGWIIGSVFSVIGIIMFIIFTIKGRV